MFAGRPTQSATSANMSIPELQLGTEMVADGVIVNKEDRTIACVKVAVDLVWNLPALAARLKMDETIMRKALSDSTQNLKVLDPAYKAYLPPVGGATVYFIGGQIHTTRGTDCLLIRQPLTALENLPTHSLLLSSLSFCGSDIAKLNDPATEIAVRVHDGQLQRPRHIFLALAARSCFFFFAPWPFPPCPCSISPLPCSISPFSPPCKHAESERRPLLDRARLHRI